MNNRRKQLYDGIAADVASQDPIQLRNTSPPMFKQVAGEWAPVLREVPIPVRAIVLPLFQQTVATKLSASLQFHAHKMALEGLIWFQDPKLYHLTIYHASTAQVRVSIPARSFTYGKDRTWTNLLQMKAALRTMLWWIVYSPENNIACESPG